MPVQDQNLPALQSYYPLIGNYCERNLRVGPTAALIYNAMFNAELHFRRDSLAHAKILGCTVGIACEVGQLITVAWRAQFSAPLVANCLLICGTVRAMMEGGKPEAAAEFGLSVMAAATDEGDEVLGLFEQTLRSMVEEAQGV